MGVLILNREQIEIQKPTKYIISKNYALFSAIYTTDKNFTLFTDKI